MTAVRWPALSAVQNVCTAIALSVTSAMTKIRQKLTLESRTEADICYGSLERHCTSISEA